MKFLLIGMMKKMNVSYDTFKEIASGAVLLVYPNSTTIEPAYYEHLKTIRWDLLERIGIVMLALLIFTTISLFQETHDSLIVTNSLFHRYPNYEQYTTCEHSPPDV